MGRKRLPRPACKHCQKPVRDRDHTFCSRQCWLAFNRSHGEMPAAVEGAVWIALTRGKFALVDAQDAERVQAINWWCIPPSATSKSWYAMAEPRKGFVITMHRFVMDAPADKQVDHRNMDGLDNRRSNLRLATQQQNICNTGLPRHNTSGYKGVTRKRTGGGKVWKAQIGVAGGMTHLGSFHTSHEAARAYDIAARQHFGEFAQTNFSEQWAG